MNSLGSNDTTVVNAAEAALQLGERARAASRVLMNAPDSMKSAALLAMADRIDSDRKALQQANDLDLEAARRNDLAAALVDRLTLSDKALDTMIAGLRQIAAMPDPVGIQSSSVIRPNGMRVGQMRVPLGVIG